MITLSPSFCGHLEAVVDAQTKAADLLGWSYDQAIEEVLTR